jgi:hypothetical protein
MQKNLFQQCLGTLKGQYLKNEWEVIYFPRMNSLQILFFGYLKKQLHAYVENTLKGEKGTNRMRIRLTNLTYLSRVSGSMGTRMFFRKLGFFAVVENGSTPPPLTTMSFGYSSLLHYKEYLSLFAGNGGWDIGVFELSSINFQ